MLIVRFFAIFCKALRASCSVLPQFGQRHAGGQRRASLHYFVLLLLCGLTPGTLAQSGQREALLLTVSDAISPATMDYLQRGIARAESAGTELVIIQLDTPGGLMASTHELIKSILASRVPVVTYVAPSGSRAASAGTYILLASHVAAMAPATHIGSATPVSMGGLPSLPSNDSPVTPEKPDNGGAKPKGATSGAMERKVLEDAVSYIRELAARHNRNADWAESAVREAANLGAQDALAANVVDLLATNIDDLLAQLDGRRVRISNAEHKLATSDLIIVRVDPDWRTRLLSVITDPNIAYFLLLIGFYGIIFEFANPGSLFPGVIGATCLLLALFAFQILSVNYAGLALIFLGVAFIVAEAFVPSFGVLGIGGIVAFVTGSVILMDGSNQAVSLPAVGGVGAVAAGFLLWAMTRLMNLRRRTPVYGVEHFTAEPARAEEAFALSDGQYQGHVRMSGERWRAVSDQAVREGELLRVLEVQGLTVRVKPTGIADH
ncbi:MAG: nodulation protein NfeD [Congregibacter sp.]|nr:nodulation protein NfeD [Congregibacter sp.]